MLGEKIRWDNEFRDSSGSCQLFFSLVCCAKISRLVSPSPHLVKLLVICMSGDSLRDPVANVAASRSVRESLSVDCRLLHNECEAESSELYRSNKYNVRLGRIMAAVGFVILVSAAPFSFWQLSSVHRVWRIRNPKIVKRHQYIIAGNFVVGLGTILYLSGPFGYVEKSNKLLGMMKDLDAVAWSAAVLEHRVQIQPKTDSSALDELQKEWLLLEERRRAIMSR